MPRTVGEMDPEVWQIQDCIGLAQEVREEIQVNSLLYAMGDSAYDVLTTFVFDEEGDDLKYDKVKEKFDQYFTVRRNVIYERAKFNQRKQEQDEPDETFITSLYCLAEYCKYGVLKEEMIGSHFGGSERFEAQ